MRIFMLTYDVMSKTGLLASVSLKITTWGIWLWLLVPFTHFLNRPFPKWRAPFWKPRGLWGPNWGPGLCAMAPLPILSQGGVPQKYELWKTGCSGGKLNGTVLFPGNFSRFYRNYRNITVPFASAHQCHALWWNAWFVSVKIRLMFHLAKISHRFFSL